MQQLTCGSTSDTTQAAKSFFALPLPVIAPTKTVSVVTPANSARGRADTGPLQLWLSNTPLTSANFTPTFGHRYTFVVATTDRVRNTGQGTATAYAVQATKYYYLGASRVAMRRTNAVSSTVTYLHTDHLGTVSIATNQSQTVLARTLNMPYGSARWISGTLPTDWGFTGQKEPIGTGLVYLHARYYASWVGRFVSADTIVPEPSHPQSLNRFAYVYNSPLNHVDPTGHDADCNIGDSACRQRVAVEQRNRQRALAWNWRPVFHRPPADPAVFRDAEEQGFGNTNFAFNNQGVYARLSGLHNGIDIGMPQGTELVAMEWGVVIGTNIWPAGENSIVIRHGNYAVHYSHLSAAPTLAEGDIVRPGDVVGLSGRANDFDHLHLEIRGITEDQLPNIVDWPPDDMYNPLYFFYRTALNEMSMEWQDYRDAAGNLNTDYNEWTMYSYRRDLTQDFWDGTLTDIAWRFPTHGR